jgi:hypothetical protein
MSRNFSYRKRFRHRSLMGVALARAVLAHKSHRLAGRNEEGYVGEGWVAKYQGCPFKAAESPSPFRVLR